MKWSGPVIRDCPIHSVQRSAVEIALFPLHSQYPFAFGMRGRALEVAGTTGITVATLEVSSGHAPFSHLDLLLRSLIVEQYYTNSLITSSQFGINETLPLLPPDLFRRTNEVLSLRRGDP